MRDMGCEGAHIFTAIDQLAGKIEKTLREGGNLPRAIAFKRLNG